VKGLIKRVLTILFAVLFVATLTASAVSADEVAAFTTSAVNADKVLTLPTSAISVDDDWCGNGYHWPWWWPWPWPPGPWPHGPYDEDFGVDDSVFDQDFQVDDRMDLDKVIQIENVREIASMR
jgi:hypothetical protein